MRIIVSFSGGKDSHACLIEAVRKYGSDKVEAVFCDTGWESEETYKHIDYVVNALGVKLHVLKAELSLVELAKKKKIFPSSGRRFCTEELKVKPMVDWVLAQEDDMIIIQGIRSGESKARAEMDQECMYFKYYVEPISPTAKPNHRYYSYRRKDVLAWIKKHDASVLRPIKDWSADQVIDCILSAGHKPNPLYYDGFARVGCFPCVMCGHKEMLAMIKNRPDGIKKVEQAESETGLTFFSSGYIPTRFCANAKTPTINEVSSYLLAKHDKGDLFKDDSEVSCMSLYHGLCE